LKNKSFVKHEKEGIIYYTVPDFDKTGLVIHAFSGRTGGVSRDAYESLNLSVLTQDCPDDVQDNRVRFTRALGIDQSCLVGAHQVHQDHIYKVTLADKGRGAFEPQTVIPDTDAMITDEKGIALTAFFADCVPVFFLDPVNKAIAIAHDGWKGTVAHIAAKTARALQDTYGTKPAELLAAVGPSIGPCHYQVDHPVIERVKEAFPLDWTTLLSDLREDGRGQLDLWEANVLQLKQVGIRSENITVARLCTYCNRDIFFSHRGKMAGRQAGLIMLK